MVNNTLDYFSKLKNALLFKQKALDESTKRLYAECTSKKEFLDYKENDTNEIRRFINLDNKIAWDDSKKVKDPLFFNKINSHLSFSKEGISLNEVVSIEEVDEKAFCYVSEGVKFDLSSIVDKSNRTVSSTSVLLDTIAGNYVLKDMANTTIRKKGVFYEICLELPAIKKINHISIVGNSFYPQNIAYIKYSKTDEERHKETVDESYSYLSNSKIFTFDTIVCKKIFIGVVQTHYKLDNVELDDKKNTCFYYNLGIRDISASFKMFDEVSAMQTHFIANSKYPREVRLYADIVSGKDCSEEFYISFDDKNWDNILPFGTRIVKERLFFKGGFCKLRFPARSIKVIKENGNVVSKYDTKESNGDIVAVNCANTPNYIYTIEYYPSRSADIKTYSFKNNNFAVHNENIKCDDSSSYRLSLAPSKYDVDVKILDNIKGRIFDGDRVSSLEDNTPFTSKKFQYAIEGDSISFTRELDNRYTVNVKYKVYNNNFKIKTILRRNSSDSLEVKNCIRGLNILVKE